VVEERLQNQDSSQPVHNLTAALDTHLAFTQHPIGLRRAESFVPQMHRHLEPLVQFLREQRSLLSLSTDGAAHVQRIANYDFPDLITADDVGQMLKIGALVLPTPRLQPLRGDAEGVGNRQAYRSGAKIEAQQPDMGPGGTNVMGRPP
jgi:hypothetical protein